MKIDEKELFKRVLTLFLSEEDPLLAMLKWTADQMMNIEAENKVGAVKNEHSSDKKDLFQRL